VSIPSQPCFPLTFSATSTTPHHLISSFLVLSLSPALSLWHIFPHRRCIMFSSVGLWTELTSY
jgi:hypothetical protein